MASRVGRRTNGKWVSLKRSRLRNFEGWAFFVRRDDLALNFQVGFDFSAGFGMSYVLKIASMA